jgi:competence protein ComEC
MSAPPLNRQPASESFFRAPLVPATLAITGGIVVDRFISTPTVVALLFAVVCLILWAVLTYLRANRLALVYLALTGVGFGAAYHHFRRDDLAADDLSRFAPDEPRPVRMRGVVDEEPLRLPGAVDPLRSTEQPPHATLVIRATQIDERGDWRPVSGRVWVNVSAVLAEMHLGDTIELTGRLAKVSGPANPGEFDLAELMRDHGIHCRLEVRKSADAVVRIERGWQRSVGGWLAVVRQRGQQELARALPDETAGVAQALLLGDGAPMTNADWSKYIRTGVIHVLAISGQHLVVLALFLWWALRLAGVGQRRGALCVALILLGYSLLTGGRPPALRSAVTVCAACGALILRRRTHAFNLFALAWLVVALVDPTDLFGTGCLLSFLSVGVLHWGVGPVLRPVEPDRLERVIDEARPTWLRVLRWLGWQVLEAYIVTLVLWLTITPLAASRYALVSPAGLLLGPPLTLLTSIALLAGFLFLLLAAIAPILAAPLVPLIHGPLALCARLVDAADGWRLGCIYVGEVPTWWLAIFYAVMLVLLAWPGWRPYWRRIALGGTGWLAVGLLAAAVRLPTNELRVTFLAVGHGGCTVLEAPDGRTLLYDAGAIAGPDVSRRQIAPYLWSRGVRRIDEVFLSHADLDHFNGLVGLLDRFAIGQVTLTPSFADKETAAVRLTLDRLRERNIPTRIVKAGDRLTAGTVELRVLHPPAVGPPGNENSRSLVLEVRHAEYVFLLTGDLEAEGTTYVLDQPRRRVDVLTFIPKYTMAHRAQRWRVARSR